MPDSSFYPSIYKDINKQRYQTILFLNEYNTGMEKFLIQNEFGQPQELIGEEVKIPGFEDLQFILHAWLYDKHGGWAITERSSGKRIFSGKEGTEGQAVRQLEWMLNTHGREALMRVLGKGDLTS